MSNATVTLAGVNAVSRIGSIGWTAGGNTSVLVSPLPVPALQSGFTFPSAASIDLTTQLPSLSATASAGTLVPVGTFGQLSASDAALNILTCEDAAL